MFADVPPRAAGARRILGVDPGLTRCGWGVVDAGPGARLRLVAVGVHRTPPGDEAASRVLALHRALEASIGAFRPDAVAVERVFAQHNVRTVMATAQAGGLAMLAAAAQGVPVRWHTPSEVKAAVTGSGRADKAQVTAMVMRLLELATPPRPADAADALALAICCAWRTPAPARSARTPAAPGSGMSPALLAAARGVAAP